MAQQAGFDPELVYCKNSEEYATALAGFKNNPVYQYVETFVFQSRLEKEVTWRYANV